ncbi:protein of unknown function (plasmid) [Nitratireductor aquimarinus]
MAMRRVIGPLKPFDQLHLKGVHLAFSGDGNIFALPEAFLSEAEADLVIALAFLVVEIPLATGLAAQPANLVLRVRFKAAHTALHLVLLPLHGVEAALRVQRYEQIVALVMLTHRVPFFAGEFEPDMAKFRREVRNCGHAGSFRSSPP